MHRATPLNTSFRAYSAGGSRGVVHNVDDGKLMQECKSNMMKNETREGIECPQNYGFTSVCADGDYTGGQEQSGGSGQGGEQSGSLKMGPESVISFMGGNRSFPFAMMDDRRHRLWNLAKDAAKGATGMFGLKEWGQQFLNTKDGMFMTGNVEKKMRFALVENKNNQKQPQQSGDKSSAAAAVRPTHFTSKSGVEFAYVLDDLPVVAPHADGGGGNGGANGGGQAGGSKKPTGQKTLHKEDSDTFFEQTKDVITSRRGKGYTEVRDDSVINYVEKPSRSSRAHKDHVHESFDGNTVWVDASGCWASMPILIKDDPCSPSPAKPGEPAAPAKVA